MIEFQNVSKRYPNGFEALKDVNLDMPEHQVTALIGPSGCGKSTLLRLLAGLERPDSGTLSCGGAEITGPGPDRGVVFQSPALFPWLTARDNVAFALRKNCDYIAARGTPLREILATGGGAKSPVWCQLQADATGLPVLVPEEREAACLGAAIVAAVSDGRFASLEEAMAACVRTLR